MPSFSCPRKCASISKPASLFAGGSCTTSGKRIGRNIAAKFPSWPKEWELMDARQLPAGWDADLTPFPADAKGMASRISSGKVLNVVAKHVPWLIGGAADLAPSTMTLLTGDGCTDFEPGNYAGRNFHFGIREHGMASAAQRHGAVERAAVRGDVLRVHRLSASRRCGWPRSASCR